MKSFGWVSPRTVAEAARLASSTVADAMISPTGQPPPSDAAVIKAGGIDLLDLMKENLLIPRQLINLREVPGLDVAVDDGPDGVRIGSMITVAHLAEHPIVRQRYNALAEAARRLASPQIRNLATMGGNLLQRPRCWYFRSAFHHCLRKGGGTCYAIPGENQYHAVFGHAACVIVHPSTLATALVALGAHVELTSFQGVTRTILLEEFLLAPETDVHRENDLRPGEVLTAIRLPLMSANARSVHVKQGEKDSFDWPIADVAVALELGSNNRCARAAVVLGAAAPVPYRAKAAEAELIGKAIDESGARAAGKAAVAGATPLARNGYKLPIFEALVRRAIMRALDPRNLQEQNHDYATPS